MQPVMPPPPGGGVIDVTASNPNAMGLGLSRPMARVDGRPMPLQWGRSQIHLAPGRHRVQISVSGLGEYGAATIVVDVAPGRWVPVYYAAPYRAWSSGAIGFQPVKSNGLTALILIRVIPAGVALLVMAVIMIVVFSQSLSH